MLDICLALVFFFSSRRRHTRLQGDWSSDVCSSDLSAVGLGKVSVTVLPATRRVRRNWGSCPGSLRLAQWQDDLPQRRVTAVMEPGRRSCRPRKSSKSFDLWTSKVVSVSGINLLSERIYTLRSMS